MKLNNSIKNIVHWNGPSVKSNDTLQTAIQRMTEGNVSGLLVRQDDTVLGVITDWDIMHSLDSGLDPGNTEVGRFMTTCEVMLDREIKSPCVQLDASISIMDALRLMAGENVHHLIITGPNDEIGIVSSLDLLKSACTH